MRSQLATSDENTRDGDTRAGEDEIRGADQRLGERKDVDSTARQQGAEDSEKDTERAWWRLNGCHGTPLGLRVPTSRIA